MLGWFVGVVGCLIAATFGVGGFGAIPDGSTTLFCGALALLFVAGLLAYAAHEGSSRF